MAKYLAELGLSPVSCTRVEAKSPYRKKPWEFGREWVDPRSKFATLVLEAVHSSAGLCLNGIEPCAEVREDTASRLVSMGDHCVWVARAHASQERGKAPDPGLLGDGEIRPGFTLRPLVAELLDEALPVDP